MPSYILSATQKNIRDRSFDSTWKMKTSWGRELRRQVMSIFVNGEEKTTALNQGTAYEESQGQVCDINMPEGRTYRASKLT